MAVSRYYYYVLHRVHMALYLCAQDIGVQPHRLRLWTQHLYRNLSEALKQNTLHGVWSVMPNQRGLRQSSRAYGDGVGHHNGVRPAVFCCA